MKKSLFSFFILNLVLLLLLTLSCKNQVEEEEPAKSLTEEELVGNQKLDQQFIDGMNEMDIEKLMSCFWDSPDLIFVDFEGNVNRGSDNIRKVFEQFFSQFESLNLVCDEISLNRAGNSVFAVGTATYTMQTKDGSSQKVTQRWTDVRGKVDGHWVYVLDHVHFLSSSNP